MPGLRLLVEVDAIGRERVLLLLLAAGLLGLRRRLSVAAALLFLGAARRARLAGAGALGDAMRDVVDRVVAGHLLFLQEIGGMAFALGENSNEHVGAGHFFAAGRLDMDHRTLDDALEAGRRLGILVIAGNEVVQFMST